jgi:hypothetical protein
MEGQPTAEEPNSPSVPSTVFGGPVHNLRVETDLTPDGTHILTPEGKHLWYVDELLIRFVPGYDLCWVGFNLIIPRNPATLPVDSQGIVPRITYHVDRNQDAWPQVSAQDGGRFNAILAQYKQDWTCLATAFMSGMLPVKLTKPLKDHDISFMRCAHCNTYRRCLTFTPEECKLGPWQIGTGDKGINTAEKACPKCYQQGGEQVDLHDEAQLYKLYMTPHTSHVVFEREPQKLALGLVFPAYGCLREIDLNNRPKWLASETGTRPVCQLLPKPSPLNDVFMHSWGPLFGGLDV